ncbi:hypothetical protein [Bradyrhizobium sp. ERR14]|uniref:hypothetical protein n=1 Tax=Bradyrhizobium sp. ERR14 TaxID=2663837 RepID=UPI0016115600|nr:hypothetical protein [Bradyrhizobium sp. ERR14]MBB4391827.1 hypothetical protein [Bradyrhizobium sp. ERR14]
MPLNITEASLEAVRAEFRELYIKDAKSGRYHLELSDLKTYVETHVSPVENELKLTLENERRLILSAALRNANVSPEGDELLIGRLQRRLAIDTVDGKRVVSILAEDGTPLVGKGPRGLATIDDLMRETTVKFPSMFNGRGMPQVNNEDASEVASKSDFNSEKARAAWVKKHGLAAYLALPTAAVPKSISRKSDFKTEKDRAAFVDANGLSAYSALPD